MPAALWAVVAVLFASLFVNCSTGHRVRADIAAVIDSIVVTVGGLKYQKVTFLHKFVMLQLDGGELFLQGKIGPFPALQLGLELCSLITQPNR